MIDKYSDLDVAFRNAVETDFLRRLAVIFDEATDDEFEAEEKKLKSLIDLDKVKEELLLEIRVCMKRTRSKIAQNWSGDNDYVPF